MSHVMTTWGIDHAFENCPAFKRERAAHPEARVFIDADAEWALCIDHPSEMVPFGLCGWCWRVYIAKRPVTKACIRYGAWEPDYEQLGWLFGPWHVGLLAKVANP